MQYYKPEPPSFTDLNQRAFAAWIWTLVSGVIVMCFVLPPSTPLAPPLPLMNVVLVLSKSKFAIWKLCWVPWKNWKFVSMYTNQYFKFYQHFTNCCESGLDKYTVQFVLFFSTCAHSAVNIWTQLLPAVKCIVEGDTGNCGRSQTVVLVSALQLPLYLYLPKKCKNISSTKRSHGGTC